VITAPLPAYVEGSPEVRFVIVGGQVFLIDSGVVVGLDALAIEAREDPERRRNTYQHRRPAVPCFSLVAGRRHPPTSAS
jgi:hypothetical protein